MIKVYRFVQKDGGPFRVAVHAKNITEAREHVKANARHSLAWRSLRYVGDGHPMNTSGWLAACAGRARE